MAASLQARPPARAPSTLHLSPSTATTTSRHIIRLFVGLRLGSPQQQAHWRLLHGTIYTMYKLRVYDLACHWQACVRRTSARAHDYLWQWKQPETISGRNCSCCIQLLGHLLVVLLLQSQGCSGCEAPGLQLLQDLAVAELLQAEAKPACEALLPLPSMPEQHTSSGHA
jgi:hypothetical protein